MSRWFRRVKSGRSVVGEAAMCCQAVITMDVLCGCRVETMEVEVEVDGIDITEGRLIRVVFNSICPGWRSKGAVSGQPALASRGVHEHGEGDTWMAFNNASCLLFVFCLDQLTWFYVTLSIFYKLTIILS